MSKNVGCTLKLSFLNCFHHLCHSYPHNVKTNSLEFFDATPYLKGVCSIRYRLKKLKIKILEKVGECWHLGEENKGVDAGAVRLVHRDRDVQEAVPSPHLINILSKDKEDNVL